LPELGRFTDKRKSTDPDLPLQWAKRNQVCATRYGLLLNEAKAILAVVPRIIDPDKAGEEEADPYILALAKCMGDEGHRVTVITEERRDRPAKMSLTTACGRLRLPCLPLEAFLEERGIWVRGQGLS
jgi:hypothetical protein